MNDCQVWMNMVDLREQLVEGVGDGNRRCNRPSTHLNISRALLQNVGRTIRVRQFYKSSQWSILDVPGRFSASLVLGRTVRTSIFLTLHLSSLFNPRFFDTTAFPKNIPYKAYACQEAKAEPPFAALGSSANR
jgi:hypothetical protein